jgi:hypothetical protein
MYPMRSKQPWEVFFHNLNPEAKDPHRVTQVIRLGGGKLPTLEDAETARRRAELYALNAMKWSRLEAALASTYMVEALLRWLREDGWDQELLKGFLLKAQGDGRADATRPGCLLRATDRVLEELRLTIRTIRRTSGAGSSQ